MLTNEAREKSLTVRRSGKSRKAKMAEHAETFARQRRTFPKMSLPTIKQAESGSLPAAIKLLCWECAGWVKQEVRDCGVVACSLYPHRPYQDLVGPNPNDA